MKHSNPFVISEFTNPSGNVDFHSTPASTANTFAKISRRAQNPKQSVRRIQVILPEGLGVVLYCSSSCELTSARVAVAMKKTGISNVWVLEGSMNAWEKEGLPVSQQLSVPREAVARSGIKIIGDDAEYAEPDGTDAHVTDARTGRDRCRSDPPKFGRHSGHVGHGRGVLLPASGGTAFRGPRRQAHRFDQRRMPEERCPRSDPDRGGNRSGRPGRLRHNLGERRDLGVGTGYHGISIQIGNTAKFL
jgi:rhodanese-related sulfurtransferase